MNANAERRERSHGAIMESATKLLRETGIAGTRVADVMKDAGLTVGGFYAHWRSKTDLVDDALRRTGGHMRDHLFRELENKPADARATVILKRYLSAAHRDAAPSAPGCPLPAVAGEIATRAPEHGPVLAEQLGLFADRLATHLPSASRRRALGLIALMYGGLALARATRGTAISEELLAAAREAGEAVLA